MVTWERAVRELGSEECRCGSQKAPGDAVCRGCWFRLPDAYRSILVHFCRPTKTAKYMGRNRKRLIYWRCLVYLGLTVKTAEREQFHPDPIQEAPCLLDSL